jgi:hypothetical protein
MGRSVALTGVMAALACSFMAQSAEAIPAFARKYQFSCSTCHSPVPRLKPFGEAFAARGFRLEDPSQEPVRATYDVGDPTLRLMRDLPLALRVEGYAQAGEKDSLKVDAQWPWVFKAMSGGQITQKISYYAYFIIETGEVGGLEDAWLQLNSVFGSPVDLTVGQFQVCDPLFKRELRLERFDYQIYGTHVGNAGVDLTYDRGLIAAWEFPGKLESVFQLVNGNGIGMADDWGNFDRDNYKNVAYRLARSFKYGRVGGFAYWGKEKGGSGIANRTYYLGPDLVIDFSDRLQLNAQYLERRDNNPYFVNGLTTGNWKTRGGFAELVYLPRGPDGKWSVAGLFNQVTSDDETARYTSVSGTLGYLLARNVRLTFDVGKEFKREGFRGSVGLITAF